MRRISASIATEPRAAKGTSPGCPAARTREEAARAWVTESTISGGAVERK
jgi:hypothetical protein